MKLAETLTRGRRQSIHDGVRIDRNEQRVALHAPHERMHPIGQIEALQHFDELQLRVALPNPIAMLDDAALQEADVPRQRNASIGR